MSLTGHTQEKPFNRTPPGRNFKRKATPGSKSPSFLNVIVDVHRKGIMLLKWVRDPDPIEEEVRRYRDAVNGSELRIRAASPAHPVTPAVDPLLMGFRDPEYECRHGRLPGDRTDPCSCWNGH